ncbi:hypothetical protein [Methylobacterium oryzae]|uniref:hypothetical protein n=1 Tax=Methylobacterium oryzae TaxID=334852 RepID=UPI001F467E40|nr:hypothetical protein [Methylobacterium oryzae]UIN38365.1 hypothetical protein LXM90_30755 [Methylobacterium oryzae]
MNWLAFVALGVLLVGTAIFDWSEGLYGACGFHGVLGALAFVAGGLVAAGVHL